MEEVGGKLGELYILSFELDEIQVEFSLTSFPVVLGNHTFHFFVVSLIGSMPGKLMLFYSKV